MKVAVFQVIGLPCIDHPWTFNKRSFMEPA